MEEGGSYELPIATDTTVGTVKGSGPIHILNDGSIAVYVDGSVIGFTQQIDVVNNKLTFLELTYDEGNTNMWLPKSKESVSNVVQSVSGTVTDGNLKITVNGVESGDIPLPESDIIYSESYAPGDTLYCNSTSSIPDDVTIIRVTSVTSSNNVDVSNIDNVYIIKNNIGKITNYSIKNAVGITPSSFKYRAQIVEGMGKVSNLKNTTKDFYIVIAPIGNSINESIYTTIEKATISFDNNGIATIESKTRDYLYTIENQSNKYTTVYIPVENFPNINFV